MISTFRKSNIRLLLTMVVVSVLITASSTLIFFQSTLAHRKEYLQQLTENEKTYILTLYRLTHDRGEVLAILHEKHSLNSGPGKTGELIITEQDGKAVELIYADSTSGNIAGDPGVYAATGNTGFIKGFDYRGKRVIGFADYLPGLEWGIVTKIDYAEIVRPFWKASGFILLALVVLVLLGIFFFQRFSSPLFKRILESEDKYHMIFELVPSGITIADVQGRIVESNRESERLLGISRDSHSSRQIDGKEWEIIGPDHSPMPASEFASTIALKENRVVSNVEMGIVKPGGHVTWLNVSAAPFPVGNLGVIVVYSDITRRVEAEKKLREHDHKMIEYAEQLKLLNDTKDKFFNIIAHDLKNPFSSLLGASEYLYNETGNFDTARVKKLAKILHDSAQNGYDILANLLEWSRSQTGSLPYKPAELDIYELVDKNLKLVAAQASEKEIRIGVNMEEGLTLTADPNMMNTVLRNLLTNALKFTHPGGTVDLEVSRKADEVIMMIRDTGVGIAEEDLGKLFRIDEKYVKNGTNEEKGTGLGLILCKELVEQHKGTIQVESKVGKGSVFIIRLPG